MAIKIGQVVRFNKYAERIMPVHAGLIAIVVTMKEVLDSDYGTPHIKIGVSVDKPIMHFCSLGGIVPKRTGLWIHEDVLYSSVEVLQPYIIDGTTFKSKDLGGFKCRIMGAIGKSDYIVEVDSNVDGNSADGRGKNGNCIIIPKTQLEYKLS